MSAKTVYCYDRYGSVKRLALVLGVVSGLASGALLMGSVQAHTAQQASLQVESLPRVVIHGSSLSEPNVAQLPRVVIEGKRSETGATQHLALANPR